MIFGDLETDVPGPAARSSRVMQPAFVYLDLGNVIFSFDRQRAFRQMAEASGADPARIETLLVAEGLQEALETGRLDWAGFHAEFSHRTGTEADPDRLARAASDMFTPLAAMVPVIAGLARAGCPFGILSNTCAVHWNHLLAERPWVLAGGPREIVLSHEVGAMKPDRRIYDVAAARAGVPPERIFFCDDIPAHVAAAREAGWDAEVFRSAGGLIDALAGRGLPLGL
jgi:putative hydrolase of the HAD superfamily